MEKATERIKLAKIPASKVNDAGVEIPATGYRVRIGTFWYWANEFEDNRYEDAPNCYYGEQDDPVIENLYVTPERGGFDAVSINGEIYCLGDWNGEEYSDCWKAEGYSELVHACFWDEKDPTTYTLRPVTVDLYDDGEEFEIVDYDICEN